MRSDRIGINGDDKQQEDENPYQSIQGTEELIRFPIGPTTKFGPHPYLVATAIMAVTYITVHGRLSWLAVGAVTLLSSPSLWAMVRAVKKQ